MDPIKNKAASDNAIRQAKKTCWKLRSFVFSILMTKKKPEGPWWFYFVGLLVLLHCPALSCIHLTGMQECRENTLEVQALSFCLARYGLRILKREREREK